MKRRTFIGGVLSALTAFVTAMRQTPLVFASPAAESSSVKSGTMILLHTNDLHGHLTEWQGFDGAQKGKTIGGVACLATAVITQSMMLLHSLQGFYPLLPLFRRMGLRTEDEIAKERYAIKAMRGDFQHVTSARHSGEETNATAEAAFEAVQ